MKKTKCMGTSKNKRAMSGGSGGKGRVSRYTKKFKKCYENFSKIAESDTDDVKNDDTKIRKMEEWGRLRGIYTYLNSKNIKSKNIEGNDGTFLDKMKGNLGDNFNKYNNAVSCLENNSAILIKDRCVLEKDYVNSKESAGIPIVKSKKAEEQTGNIEVDEVEPAQANAKRAREETQRAEEEAKTANEERLKAEADAEKARQERLKAEADAEKARQERLKAEDDNQPEAVQSDDEAAVEAPAPEATVVVQPGIAVDEAPVATAEVSDDEAAVKAPDADDEAANEAHDIDADADAYKQRADQGGGRSKRRQKYSRRRGKSMKSKKGRKTRRR